MDAVAYDVPVRYLCPISHTIMQNPVKFVTRNGIAITYEREYICEWIRVGKGRCAITREPLAVEDLEEDRELRYSIFQIPRVIFVISESQTIQCQHICTVLGLHK